MLNRLSRMPVSSMEIEEGKLPDVATPPVAIPSILPALANRGQQAEASKRNLNRAVEETSETGLNSSHHPFVPAPRRSKSYGVDRISS